MKIRGKKWGQSFKSTPPSGHGMRRKKTAKTFKVKAEDGLWKKKAQEMFCSRTSRETARAEQATRKPDKRM